MRESREAHAELEAALAELSAFADRAGELVTALRSRVKAASFAGQERSTVTDRGIVNSRMTEEPLELSRYAAVLSLAELTKLQDRVTAAAERAAEARKATREINA